MANTKQTKTKKIILIIIIIIIIIIINIIILLKSINNKQIDNNQIAMIDIVKDNDNKKTKFEQFEMSLFYDINKEFDKLKYKKLLSYIYNIQFNHSCDLNKKYYIFSIEDFPTNRGFMSFIDHQYTQPFILSLYTNRTFIFIKNSDKNPWIYLPKNGITIKNLCKNRTGHHCIFKPISNCTIKQINKIINYAKKNNNYSEINRKNPRIKPQICRKSKYFTPDSFHQLTKNYMVIVQKSKCNMFWNRGYIMNRGLIENMININKFNINYFQFSAIIWSIIMRLQENIKEIINNIINNLLLNKYKNKWKSKNKTISLIIRGSDKCMNNNNNNNQYLNGPEMKCFHPKNFINIAQIIKIFHDEINSIIITSEDKNIINYIKNNISSSSSLSSIFNFIYNDQDIMQNCGLVQDLNDNQKTNEFQMFKLLISMLSTLKLQSQYSNYYIIQKQSNWGHSIWTISSSFDNDNYNNKYCINVETLKNTQKQYIYWDDKLLIDDNNNKNIIKSKFNNNNNNNLIIHKYNNNCFRKDRFDFAKG